MSLITSDRNCVGVTILQLTNLELTVCEDTNLIYLPRKVVHTLALAYDILKMWFSIKDDLLISLEIRVFWRSLGSVDYRTQASNETHTCDTTLEQKKGMLQALMLDV